MKTQPYISRIHIKNFRNFKEVDFPLSEKQVIIGENSVGKSNLIRALQLILDPNLSEKDRMLEEDDFWDGLEKPVDNGEEILVEIYFDNFMDNIAIMAQLSDALVRENEKELLKISYKYYRKEEKNNVYSYVLYKGENIKNSFTYDDRKLLNMRVIKAIRDVESEMRNSRTSPLTQIIKNKYSISGEILKNISKSLDEKGADTLHIGQVNDLETKLDTLLNDIVAFGEDEFNVTLKTMNLDATKLLYALRPLINAREAGNTSLGINNILYIALILLLIEDDTIKSYLSFDQYQKIKERDKNDTLSKCYTELENGDYYLNPNVLDDNDLKSKLYDLLAYNLPNTTGVTILAVEEPEAHLHPIYQRLLYKHIMTRNNNSVMITTHSTHISSVAPINSLVHLLSKNKETVVSTTANLNLEQSDYDDLSRYIDVKRGEIYTAKGIVFVEGIAEEYLIPRFSEILKCNLDRLGIVVCNVNSTNFSPYARFAEKLGIPFVIITDGDYYHFDGKDKKFGDLISEKYVQCGFDGIDRSKKMFPEKITDDFDSKSYDDKRIILNQNDIFVGENTLEIDIFNRCNKQDLEIICEVFNQLTNGGSKQKQNFKSCIEAGEFNKCLSKIESSASGVGKGRFAQRLAGSVTSTMIPSYIENAINRIVKKTRGL